MAEPIEIIIRKGSGGEGTGFGIPNAGMNTPGGRSTAFGTEGGFLNEKQSGDKALIAMKAFALATLKKQIGYSIAQYGNMTGNYIQQAEIQLAMENINNISSLVGAGLIGLKTGGAAGAAVGIGIATANIGINYFNQFRTLMTNITKLDTYANIMQERSGGIYANDSRGTYN